MSRLKKALDKKDLKGKQATPKATKAKTFEEVVAGNTTINKAITAYHKATTLEANALTMKAESVKVITDYGVTRMFERQNTQNITLTGKEGDVYICLKDQYTLKVNEDSEKCDELEAFLEEKGIAPDSVVTYEEKASLDIKKMTDKEVAKLVDMLDKTFGQERMDEIFSVKTTPQINGLVAMFPTLCETQEDWTKLSTMVKQHKPTVNIPSKKGKK